MNTLKLERKITYVHVNNHIQWAVSGAFIGIPRNGVANNMLRAKKAAQHTLRQHQQKENREANPA